MKSAVVTGAPRASARPLRPRLCKEGSAVIGTSRNASAIPANQRIDRVDYRDLDLVDRGGVDLVVELGHRSATAGPGDSP